MGVKTGIFLSCEGVALSADAVHGLGQLGGGIPRGSLKGHMLNKMGNSTVPLFLVHSTAGNPYAKAGGSEVGKGLHQYAQPVGQSELLYHINIPILFSIPEHAGKHVLMEVFFLLYL